MTTFASPRVQVTEIDISEFLTGLPTSVGVLVVRSRRGEPVPRFVSSTRKFKELYCLKQYRLDVGYPELYAGLNFLENGYAGLWVVRAVHSDVKYACVVVNTSDSTDATTLVSGGLGINADKTGPVIPDWGSLGGTGNTPLFLLYAKSPGAVGNNLSVMVTGVNSAAKTFLLTVKETLPDGSVEIRVNNTVSLNPEAKDGYGNSIYLLDVLASNDYVGAAINTGAGTLLPKELSTAVRFAGGDDGTAPTIGDIGECMDRFKNREQWDVDILIQGGVGGDVYRNKLVEVAEARGDAVAVLDVDEDMYRVESLSTWRRNTFTISTSYAWLITPWLKMYDFDNDKEVFVPPSGVVAGMMARCDYEYDPWWVPCGLRRGSVKVLGLKYYYSLAERDELDKIQINPFVRKPGVIALWNNRTLQAFESAFSFIETRRLLNYVKKNVCRTLDAYLFEPLVDSTRERIVAALDEFLRTIKMRAGLYDYKVVSDPLGTGNNPANQVDQGILTIEIYLKPVRAIRHIWLKAIVTRTGYNLEEKMM